MRESGILMPVFSLPSDYGIGTMGKEAYNFIDFLEKSGQKYWQILPLGQTSYGDSPYQSFSAFAGNPYFIDLDMLCEDGLLSKEDYAKVNFGELESKIDYSVLFNTRYKVLHKAYDKFREWYPEYWYAYTYENGWWLDDYAAFMTAKELNDLKPLSMWDMELRLRTDDAMRKLWAENEYEIGFWKFCQYKFSEQWHKLKNYANEKGIKIMGDMPIYVSADSADVWAAPHLFELDEAGFPTSVAGCPPDYFSEDGQLWGNPLYRWSKHEETGFDWWVRRVRYSMGMMDTLRIDHFRGFAGYYAIPYKDTTARNGEWREGPGYKLFEALENNLGKVSIVAEDLGQITEDVHELREKCGFPGMKVIQFAFSGPDNEYLPHYHIQNSVVYTGTHDNETTVQWIEKLGKEEKKFASEYLGLNEVEGLANGILRSALSSVAKLAIIPLQDYMLLGAEGRINVPGEMMNNWTWRITKSKLKDEKLAKRIKTLCERYHR